MLPVLSVMRESAYTRRRIVERLWVCGKKPKETGSLIFNTAYPDRRFRIRKESLVAEFVIQLKYAVTCKPIISQPGAMLIVNLSKL